MIRIVFALKHVLFAFVELDIPASKDSSPLCILFTPLQMHEDSNAPISPWWDPDAPAMKPFYTHMSYKVDHVSRQFTIVSVTDRQARQRMLNKVARLYDVPQAEWPCGLANWVHQIGDFIIDVNEVPNRRCP